MELLCVALNRPDNSNVIFGQSHFVKTVEDLYEAIVNTVPQAKFGIAFCEASGACLVRAEGNDDELKQAAVANALAVGAGHTFCVIVREAYPINLLGRIREVPEVVGIYCATANPVQVIVAETELGRGVLGVIDGASPKGVEGPDDIEWRHNLLRKFGYKR
jgi:adenosine/AMP kinase